MATGVLPIAIGQATRIIPYVDHVPKEYVASLTLGVVSDTQDIWGELTFRQAAQVTVEQFREAMQSFVGRIEQEPPMYSAVHHQGQRLYELARQGRVVEREKREIEIMSLELLTFSGTTHPQAAQMRVLCSRGTYIRTLCHDIGAKLETGAVMSSLTRTRSGSFSLAESAALDEVLEGTASLKKRLLPLDYPLYQWPSIQLSRRAEAQKVSNGCPLPLPIDPGCQRVRVYDPDRTFIAVARVDHTESHPCLKPERVFSTLQPKEKEIP